MIELLGAVGIVVGVTAMLVVGQRQSRRRDLAARDAIAPLVGRHINVLVGFRTLRVVDGRLQSIERRGVIVATGKYEYLPFSQIREIRTDEGTTIRP